MKQFQRITLILASAVLVPLAGCAGTNSNVASTNPNDSRPFDHKYDARAVPDAKYPNPGFYDNRTARWNAMYSHYE